MKLLIKIMIFIYLKIKEFFLSKGMKESAGAIGCVLLVSGCFEFMSLTFGVIAYFIIPIKWMLVLNPKFTGWTFKEINTIGILLFTCSLILGLLILGIHSLILSINIYEIKQFIKDNWDEAERKTNVFLKIKKPEVIIPDRNIIHCEIETPQFLGSQDKFRMYRQTGTFYKKSLLFKPDTIFGHKVQFSSIEDFKKAVNKIM